MQIAHARAMFMEMIKYGTPMKMGLGEMYCYDLKYFEGDMSDAA